MKLFRKARVATLTTFTAAASLASVAALAGPAASASAQPAPHPSTDFDTHFVKGGAVFAETDSPTGNQVVAYARARNGELSLAAVYETGGLGGVLAGSVVDHQASQGALLLDRSRGLLFATNAGSGTVSVFAVRGDDLRLIQVVPSGGDFPVSVARHGHLLYVLNARGGGNVSGFRIAGDRLVALPGSTRPLGLDPAATPEFVNTPGQVAFSPDGRFVVVTTKANGNDVDVFAVRGNGRLSDTPVVNSEPGAVPFAVSFTSDRQLQVVEAGSNSLASFVLSSSGSLALITSSPSGQTASCWVTRIGKRSYVSNAGSGTLTTYAVGRSGTLADLGNTATDAGTTDSAATPSGEFLYVQAGAAGQIDEFSVGVGGSLRALGSVTVPDAVGGEGLAAA